MPSVITPNASALDDLIEALAEIVARDYLRELASNDADDSDGQAERVLPRLDEAA